MGVRFRQILCIALLGHSLPVWGADPARPATQSGETYPPISFSCYGGFGGFSVAIASDGSYTVTDRETRSGRLSRERHVVIVKAVQDVIKLRNIPLESDSSVRDGATCRLNYGGIPRAWRAWSENLPPQITRLRDLLAPTQFEVASAASQRTEGPDR